MVGLISNVVLQQRAVVVVLDSGTVGAALKVVARTVAKTVVKPEVMRKKNMRQ